MEAFVTLATSDVYACGALVLAHSLKNVQTTKKLVCLATPSVSPDMIGRLSAVFDLVEVVDVIDSNDAANLRLLARPDLGVTFTKLHCWRLTQFSKCVFMDADTLVLQNIDDLFLREELSASPDAGWPDCFNSGVFVFRPSDTTYNALLEFALETGSFDGGDQGLLNSFFKDWATKDIAKHLPFVYNVVSQAFYSYLPAVRQFGHDIKVVHFAGERKPWHVAYNRGDGTLAGQAGEGGSNHVLTWWRIYTDKVDCEHKIAALVTVSGGSPSHHGSYSGQCDAGEFHDDPSTRYHWEQGAIDYMGRDSFDNIQKQLDGILKNGDATKKTTTVETDSSDKTKPGHPVATLTTREPVTPSQPTKDSVRTSK